MEREKFLFALQCGMKNVGKLAGELLEFARSSGVEPGALNSVSAIRDVYRFDPGPFGLQIQDLCCGETFYHSLSHTRAMVRVEYSSSSAATNLILSPTMILLDIREGRSRETWKLCFKGLRLPIEGEVYENALTFSYKRSSFDDYVFHTMCHDLQVKPGNDICGDEYIRIMPGENYLNTFPDINSANKLLCRLLDTVDLFIGSRVCDGRFACVSGFMGGNHE